jgi:hypothetical protein
MLSAHKRSVKAVMDLRLEEAQQAAESRALLRQVTIQPRTWLPHQECRLLCQLGRLLVIDGPQTLSLNGELGLIGEPR